MAKRMLSHLLIGLATLALVNTLFIWLVDGVVLNPDKLVPAMRDSDVPTAISKAVPDLAANDAPEEERALIQEKINQVITPQYVDEKIETVAGTTVAFIKGEAATPTLNLSDIPVKLEAIGVPVDAEMRAQFAQPIVLNERGALNGPQQAYESLRLLKIAGIVIFIILMLAEWFVTEKGQKVRRLGRVFMYTAVWYFLFWGALVVGLRFVKPKIKLQTETLNELARSLLSAVQSLLSVYLLSYAAVCAVIAIGFYFLRRYYPKPKVATQAYKSPPNLPNKR